METFGLLLHSVKAILTILLISASGVLLVRFKVLSEGSLHVLSKIVFCLMLPCLLFTKVSETVDFGRLKELWILPFSCVLYTFTGLCLGYLSSKALKFSEELMPLTMCSCGFSNSGYLPIPLMTAICAMFPVFSANPESEALSITYISMYLIIFSPLLWGVGYNLIAGRPFRKMNVSYFVTPPLIGLGTGLIVGLVPEIKGIFCGKSGMLYPFFQAGNTIGQAVVPCALIVLGGSFAGNFYRSVPDKKIIFTVITVKLIIMPLLAVLYIIGLRNIGMVSPGNMIMAMVLLVESAVPTATNLAVITSIHNRYVGETGPLLFWTYLASLPSLTFFIVFGMRIFS